MDKIKKTMGTLAAIAVLAGGAVGVDDTFTKKIHLKATDKMYSNFEYRQERKSIGDKGAIAGNIDDWNETQLYVEILNVEIDNCRSKECIECREENKDNCENECRIKLHPMENNQNIFHQVKKFDKSGCPKQ